MRYILFNFVRYIFVTLTKHLYFLKMSPKPKTIWSTLCDELPEVEHYEAKTLLGLGLIEQVEELMAEVFKNRYH